ncbi:unnamed protein product, partial [Closterium sp. NIES-54]
HALCQQQCALACSSACHLPVPKFLIGSVTPAATFMVISRCCSRYVIKGLPMGYNLMRRMVTLLGMQGDPNHPSYDCPDCKKSDDDQEASRGKTNRSRHRWDNQPRKERQTSKTSSAKDADSLGSNARGDGAASFSMVGVVEPTILMVPEAGEDFQAVAAAV